MDIAIAAICASLGGFLGAALWEILAVVLLCKYLDDAERRAIQMRKESAERSDDE